MTSLLLTSMLVAAPIPAEAAGEAERRQLDGAWRLVRYDYRGESQDTRSLTISNHMLLILDGECAFNVDCGKLTISSTNKTFDLAMAHGMNKGFTLPARFEREGNTLRIAMRRPLRSMAPRPEQLATTKDTPHFLYVFQRDTTATREHLAELIAQSRTLAAKYEMMDPTPNPEMVRNLTLEELVQRETLYHVCMVLYLDRLREVGKP